MKSVLTLLQSVGQDLRNMLVDTCYLLVLLPLAVWFGTGWLYRTLCRPLDRLSARIVNRGIGPDLVYLQRYDAELAAKQVWAASLRGQVDPSLLARLQAQLSAGRARTAEFMCRAEAIRAINQAVLTML
jgi:hypothetical protein